MYHLVVIGAYNHDITGIIVFTFRKSVDVMSFTNINIKRSKRIFSTYLTLARIKLFQIMNDRRSKNSMRMWTELNCKMRIGIGSINNMLVIFLRQVRRDFLT